MKQRKRRAVNVAGTVLLRHTGRAALVYGPPYRFDLLEHQVWVTEAELLLGIDFEREVPVGKTTVDGLFRKDGNLFAVEVDNAGKQGKDQYADKWERLGRFEGYVLVVCHTDVRMQSLIEWAETQKSACLFSTFGRLRAEEPWTDWYGNTAEI